MAKDKRRIQQNKARKKAKANARKRVRRQQRAKTMSSVFAREGTSRNQISRSPIHGAWRSSTLFEQGIGEVMVARKLPDGRVAMGLFLVDSYCLGVKNAFLSILPLSSFEEQILNLAGGRTMDEVSPDYARKLVEDSIVYARDLGFEPHEDVEDAEIVFGDIDPSACPETFTFGHEGKPLFINGPNISARKSEAIIQRLTEKLGPEGFHYVVGMGENPGDVGQEWDEDEDEFDPNEKVQGVDADGGEDEDRTGK